MSGRWVGRVRMGLFEIKNGQLVNCQVSFSFTIFLKLFFFFYAMWSSVDLLLEHFEWCWGILMRVRLHLSEIKKFTRDDGEKRVWRERSLKLITPFETCSDALEMIITLQHHTLNFTVIGVQKHLKASPETKAFRKYVNKQVSGPSVIHTRRTAAL